jgi:hypothetical protein
MKINVLHKERIFSVTYYYEADFHRSASLLHNRYRGCMLSTSEFPPRKPKTKRTEE